MLEVEIAVFSLNNKLQIMGRYLNLLRFYRISSCYLCKQNCSRVTPLMCNCIIYRCISRNCVSPIHTFYRFILIGYSRKSFYKVICFFLTQGVQFYCILFIKIITRTRCHPFDPFQCNFLIPY